MLTGTFPLSSRPSAASGGILAWNSVQMSYKCAELSTPLGVTEQLLYVLQIKVVPRKFTPLGFPEGVFHF